MKLLHIDSSILGDHSASRKLSAAIVERLRRAGPAPDVTRRDLAAEPLSHLTLAALPGGASQDVLASQTALDEFLAADTVVIGAPMYNFTVPSQLKAWIDRILIADKTFRYGPNGPEGLAGGKRVIVAVARGGLYGPSAPAASFEHLETYLRAVFAFIGIVPEFIVAEGLKASPDQGAAALSAALNDASALNAMPVTLAA